MLTPSVLALLGALGMWLSVRSFREAFILQGTRFYFKGYKIRHYGLAP